MPKSRVAGLRPLALAGLPLMLLSPLSTSRLAAQTLRMGVELQVNSYTTDAQRFPSVSLDAVGDFVVAWESNAQEGSGYGIFAHRFTSAGTAQSVELQVNSRTVSNQQDPSVSLDADGDFVVVWTGSSSQDGSDDGVFARRFSAAGVAQGVEFQVNSYTTNDQYYASVSLDADGDFVVVWQSYAQDGPAGSGVFARRFTSAGAAQGNELQVNAFTAGYQLLASVSLDADGDFVVAWSSVGQDGDSGGIFARRFSSAGNALGGEVQVNSFTTSSQTRPSVSLDADGDFAVAWESTNQDGSSLGVFARRFSSAGIAQTADLQINSFTTGNQRHPTVSLGADGDFVVAWHSDGQDGSSNGVFARRFSAAGVAATAELQVNSYTADEQSYPALSLGGGGRFVVAWESSGQDGSDSGIFAQRFKIPAVLDIDGNGATAALTDGLLVLRHLFGFTGATLTVGAVDVVNCTRCDAASIQAYLQTLI